MALHWIEENTQYGTEIDTGEYAVHGTALEIGEYAAHGTTQETGEYADMYILRILYFNFTSLRRY